MPVVSSTASHQAAVGDKILSLEEIGTSLESYEVISPMLLKVLPSDLRRYSRRSSACLPTNCYGHYSYRNSQKPIEHAVGPLWTF